MVHKFGFLAAAGLTVLVAPAAPSLAEVAAQSEAGFVVKLTAETTAPQDAAWTSP